MGGYSTPKEGSVLSGGGGTTGQDFIKNIAMSMQGGP